MSNKFGSIGEPRIQLSDFDTDKYKCIAAEVSEDGVIACAFMSHSADPPHYRVVCGSQNLFCTSRKEVLELMEQFKRNTNKKERGRKS